MNTKVNSLALVEKWRKTNYHDWMAEWDRQIQSIIGDDPKGRAMVAVAWNLNRLAGEGTSNEVPYDQLFF
jgi:hypothetical protein